MAFFKTWTLGKHFALSLLVSTIVSYISRLFPRSEASSIGIIGGVDGPTAVFISGKLMTSYRLVFVVVLIVLMLLYSPVRNWLQALGQ